MDNNQAVFTFVILNYCCTQETINCAMSIEKLEYKNKYIVIVDNNSQDTDEFFKMSMEKLKEYNNICFLKSGVNGGYAKGNNIGIYYAKYVLKSDYVCVVNPDAVVVNTDFIKKTIELYDRYKFCVCGPAIIQNGENINPIGVYDESVLRIFLSILNNYRIYFTKKYRLKRFAFWKKNKKNKLVHTKTSYGEKKLKPDENKNMILSKEDKLKLSGACVIFSPMFLKNYDGFYSGTFLYCEESILACACFNIGLKMLYSSEIIVEHEGGMSPINDKSKDEERLMDISKIGAKSATELLKVICHKRNRKYIEKVIRPKKLDFSIIKENSLISE